ncbi:MAG: DNA recombination protein RmuC [Archangium sp.]
MGIALAALALMLGGIVGWLLARRSSDAATRAVELELAAAKAALAAKDLAVSRVEHELREQRVETQQLTGVMTTTRSEFARVEAEGRLLRQRVEELQDCAAADAASLVETQTALRQAEAEVARLGASAARVGELEAQVAEHEGLVEGLRNRVARAEASLESERVRATDIEKTRGEMKLEFESLSKRLLDEKLQQSEKGIEGLLGPVREKLKTFEEKVQQTWDQDNRDRATLYAHLKGLSEAQSRLHADAQALSRALSGEARAQGDWGELVLERLLETVGLTEGREYDLQVDSVGEDGRRRRPDALVYLPGDRVIIVDSKCSLQAFIASSKAQSDQEREDDLDAHVHSLRTHVKLLSAKDYRLVTKSKTVDFVFLFVPNEAAFHAALSRAPEILEESLKHNVVIVSPTTLLTTLQMVHHVWRSERQTLNAQQIAADAGKMVDKLSAAMASFDVVGQRLRQAGDSFDDAKRRLGGKGSALSLAKRVHELGARVAKADQLAQLEKSYEVEPLPAPKSSPPRKKLPTDDQQQLLLDSGGDQPC